ncbi:MAG: hypothetical protein JSW61_13835 [Candidatus Thorarchaeota archaeon]|nr:MAG: hypothetical protein JSW61_13835 [Candidatus Thorarchaeota archaeon]
MAIGYEIQDDGTSLEIEVNRAKLASEKAYLIVDKEGAKIYIWLGRTAGVRMRFISAHAAQNLKTEYGNGYRVWSLDEGEEPSNFLRILG